MERFKANAAAAEAARREAGEELRAKVKSAMGAKKSSSSAAALPAPFVPTPALKREINLKYSNREIYLEFSSDNMEEAGRAIHFTQEDKTFLSYLWSKIEELGLALPLLIITTDWELTKDSFAAATTDGKFLYIHVAIFEIINKLPQEQRWVFRDFLRLLFEGNQFLHLTGLEKEQARRALINYFSKNQSHYEIMLYVVVHRDTFGVDFADKKFEDMVRNFSLERNMALRLGNSPLEGHGESIGITRRKDCFASSQMQRQTAEAVSSSAAEASSSISELDYFNLNKENVNPLIAGQHASYRCMFGLMVSVLKPIAHLAAPSPLSNNFVIHRAARVIWHGRRQETAGAIGHGIVRISRVRLPSDQEKGCLEGTFIPFGRSAEKFSLPLIRSSSQDITKLSVLNQILSLRLSDKNIPYSLIILVAKVLNWFQNDFDEDSFVLIDNSAYPQLKGIGQAKLIGLAAQYKNEPIAWLHEIFEAAVKKGAVNTIQILNQLPERENNLWYLKHFNARCDTLKHASRQSRTQIRTHYAIRALTREYWFEADRAFTERLKSEQQKENVFPAYQKAEYAIRRIALLGKDLPQIRFFDLANLGEIWLRSVLYPVVVFKVWVQDNQLYVQPFNQHTRQAIPGAGLKVLPWKEPFYIFAYATETGSQQPHSEVSCQCTGFQDKKGRVILELRNLAERSNSIIVEWTEYCAKRLDIQQIDKILAQLEVAAESIRAFFAPYLESGIEPSAFPAYSLVIQFSNKMSVYVPIKFVLTQGEKGGIEHIYLIAAQPIKDVPGMRIPELDAAIAIYNYPAFKANFLAQLRDAECIIEGLLVQIKGKTSRVEIVFRQGQFRILDAEKRKLVYTLACMGTEAVLETSYGAQIELKDGVETPIELIPWNESEDGPGVHFSIVTLTDKYGKHRLTLRNYPHSEKGIVVGLSATMSHRRNSSPEPSQEQIQGYETQLHQYTLLLQEALSNGGEVPDFTIFVDTKGNNVGRHQEFARAINLAYAIIYFDNERLQKIYWFIEPAESGYIPPALIKALQYYNQKQSFSAQDGCSSATPASHSPVTFEQTLKPEYERYPPSAEFAVDLRNDKPVVQGLDTKEARNIAQRLPFLLSNRSHAPPLFIQITPHTGIDPASGRKYLFSYEFDGTRGLIKIYPAFVQSDEELADFLGVSAQEAELFTQAQLDHEINQHHLLGNYVGLEAETNADIASEEWLGRKDKRAHLEAVIKVLSPTNPNGVYAQEDWLEKLYVKRLMQREPNESCGKLILESTDGEEFCFTYVSRKDNWFHILVENGKEWVGRIDVKTNYVDYAIDNDPCSSRRDWALLVEDKYQKRGIGRALLSLALGVSRQNGYDSFYIHPAEGLEPYYESLGFADGHRFDLTSGVLPKILITDTNHGIKLAQKNTQRFDQCVHQALFDSLSDPDSGVNASDSVAVLGVGSVARQEMVTGSDADIIILVEKEGVDTKRLKDRFLKHLAVCLQNTKLKIIEPDAVHCGTVASCKEYSQFNPFTSEEVKQLRFIAGTKELLGRLTATPAFPFVLERNDPVSVASVYFDIFDYEREHCLYEEKREFNVKKSRGMLRDILTICMIGRTIYGIKGINSLALLQGMRQRGYLSEDDFKKLAAALSFYLRARDKLNAIYAETECLDKDNRDILTEDKAPKLARFWFSQVEDFKRELSEHQKNVVDIFGRVQGALTAALRETFTDAWVDNFENARFGQMSETEQLRFLESCAAQGERIYPIVFVLAWHSASQKMLEQIFKLPISIPYWCWIIRYALAYNHATPRAMVFAFRGLLKEEYKQIRWRSEENIESGAKGRIFLQSCIDISLAEIFGWKATERMMQGVEARRIRNKWHKNLQEALWAIYADKEADVIHLGITQNKIEILFKDEPKGLLIVRRENTNLWHAQVADLSKIKGAFRIDFKKIEDINADFWVGSRKILSPERANLLKRPTGLCGCRTHSIMIAYRELERFINQHAFSFGMVQDGTIHDTTPCPVIYNVFCELKQRFGSLRDKRLLDFGSGDLRVAFMAVCLFGMKVTSVEKDPSISQLASPILGEAVERRIVMQDNLDFLPVTDAFSIPWKDFDIVFFFYTQPFDRMKAKRFRQSIQEKVKKLKPNGVLAILFTEEQLLARQDEFFCLRLLLQTPLFLSDAKGGLYLQLYQADSVDAGRMRRYPAVSIVDDSERKKGMQSEAEWNLRSYLEAGMDMLCLPSDKIELNLRDRCRDSVAELAAGGKLDLDLAGLGARAPPLEDTEDSRRFQIIINDILRHEVLGHHFYAFNEAHSRQLSCQYFLRYPSELRVMLDTVYNKNRFGLVFDESYLEELRKLEDVKSEISPLKKQIILLAEGRLTPEELCAALDCRLVLKVGSRIILKTNDDKYFIKIYTGDEFSLPAYQAEKSFFTRYNPTGKPELLYYNDQAQALVVENLETLGLIRMFECMQQHLVSEAKLKHMAGSMAQVLADLHTSVAVNAQVSADDYRQIKRRVMDAVGFLRYVGYAGIPSVDEIERFFAQAERVVFGEDKVYTHGDYLPWNIFVDSASGKVLALLDGELSGIDSPAKELANVFFGLIDARKNHPCLIASMETMLNVFMEEYLKIACSGNRTETFTAYLMQRIHFYCVAQLLIGARVAHEKWNKWAEFRLGLAAKLLRLKEFSLSAFVRLLVEDINGQYPIGWAGNFDAICAYRSGPISGQKWRIPEGDWIDFFAQVYVPGKIGDHIFGTSIAAAIEVQREDTLCVTFWHPFEFIGTAGNNYLFRAGIGNLSPGCYRCKPVFSTDAGKTWYRPKLPYGPFHLEVAPVYTPKSLHTQIRAVVFGDIHGELSGFRNALEQLGIIRKQEHFMNDSWVLSGVTVVVAGDFIDRGERQIELYEYLKRLAKTAEEKNNQLIMLIGNHELQHFQGIPEDNRAAVIVPQIKEDILNGKIRAAVYVGGRIVVHGGILPIVLFDIIRKLRPQFLDLLAYRLQKTVSELTAEEVSLELQRQPEILPLEHIVSELDRRLRVGISLGNFSDIIFQRGNAHFGANKKSGEPGYEPGGIFWADYDNELAINEPYLPPQICAHKEGDAVRWTEGARVINVNLRLKNDSFGRNAGVAVLDGSGVWRAVYFDGREGQPIPSPKKTTPGLFWNGKNNFGPTFNIILPLTQFSDSILGDPFLAQGVSLPLEPIYIGLFVAGVLIIIGSYLKTRNRIMPGGSMKVSAAKPFVIKTKEGNVIFHFNEPSDFQVSGSPKAEPKRLLGGITVYPPMRGEILIINPLSSQTVIFINKAAQKKPHVYERVPVNKKAVERFKANAAAAEAAKYDSSRALRGKVQDALKNRAGKGLLISYVLFSIGVFNAYAGLETPAQDTTFGEVINNIFFVLLIAGLLQCLRLLWRQGLILIDLKIDEQLYQLRRALEEYYARPESRQEQLDKALVVLQGLKRRIKNVALGYLRRYFCRQILEDARSGFQPQSVERFQKIYADLRARKTRYPVAERLYHKIKNSLMQKLQHMIRNTRYNFNAATQLLLRFPDEEILIYFLRAVEETAKNKQEGGIELFDEPYFPYEADLFLRILNDYMLNLKRQLQNTALSKNERRAIARDLFLAEKAELEITGVANYKISRLLEIAQQELELRQIIAMQAGDFIRELTELKNERYSQMPKHRKELIKALLLLLHAEDIEESELTEGLESEGMGDKPLDRLGGRMGFDKHFGRRFYSEDREEAEETEDEAIEDQLEALRKLNESQLQKRLNDAKRYVDELERKQSTGIEFDGLLLALVWYLLIPTERYSAIREFVEEVSGAKDMVFKHLKRLSRERNFFPQIKEKTTTWQRQDIHKGANTLMIQLHLFEGSQVALKEMIPEITERLRRGEGINYNDLDTLYVLYLYGELADVEQNIFVFSLQQALQGEDAVLARYAQEILFGIRIKQAREAVLRKTDKLLAGNLFFAEFRVSGAHLVIDFSGHCFVGRQVALKLKGEELTEAKLQKVKGIRLYRKGGGDLIFMLCQLGSKQIVIVIEHTVYLVMPGDNRVEFIPWKRTKEMKVSPISVSATVFPLGKNVHYVVKIDELSKALGCLSVFEGLVEARLNTCVINTVRTLRLNNIQQPDARIKAWHEIIDRFLETPVYLRKGRPCMEFLPVLEKLKALDIPFDQIAVRRVPELSTPECDVWHMQPAFRVKNDEKYRLLPVILSIGEITERSVVGAEIKNRVSFKSQNQSSASVVTSKDAKQGSFWRRLMKAGIVSILIGLPLFILLEHLGLTVMYIDLRKTAKAAHTLIYWRAVPLDMAVSMFGCFFSAIVAQYLHRGFRDFSWKYSFYLMFFGVFQGPATQATFNLLELFLPWIPHSTLIYDLRRTCLQLICGFAIVTALNIYTSLGNHFFGLAKYDIKKAAFKGLDVYLSRVPTVLTSYGINTFVPYEYQPLAMNWGYDPFMFMLAAYLHLRQEPLSQAALCKLRSLFRAADSASSATYSTKRLPQNPPVLPSIKSASRGENNLKTPFSLMPKDKEFQEKWQKIFNSRDPHRALAFLLIAALEEEEWLSLPGGKRRSTEEWLARHYFVFKDGKWQVPTKKDLDTLYHRKQQYDREFTEAYFQHILRYRGYNFQRKYAEYLARNMAIIVAANKHYRDNLQILNRGRGILALDPEKGFCEKHLTGDEFEKKLVKLLRIKARCLHKGFLKIGEINYPYTAFGYEENLFSPLYATLLYFRAGDIFVINAQVFMIPKRKPKKEKLKQLINEYPLSIVLGEEPTAEGWGAYVFEDIFSGNHHNVFVPVIQNLIAMQHIRDAIKDRPFFDVGSRNGLYAITAAKLGASRVYLIEKKNVPWGKTGLQLDYLKELMGAESVAATSDNNLMEANLALNGIGSDRFEIHPQDFRKLASPLLQGAEAATVIYNLPSYGIDVEKDTQERNILESIRLLVVASQITVIASGGMALDQRIFATITGISPDKCLKISLPESVNKEKRFMPTLVFSILTSLFHSREMLMRLKKRLSLPSLSSGYLVGKCETKIEKGGKVYFGRKSRFPKILLRGFYYLHLKVSDVECLSIIPEEVYARNLETFSSYMQEDFRRHTLGGGKQTIFQDKKGYYIVLPENATTLCPSGSEVILIGCFDYIEVWPIKRWEEYKNKIGADTLFFQYLKYISSQHDSLRHDPLIKMLLHLLTVGHYLEDDAVTIFQDWFSLMGLKLVGGIWQRNLQYVLYKFLNEDFSIWRTPDGEIIILQPQLPQEKRQGFSKAICLTQIGDKKEWYAKLSYIFLDLTGFQRLEKEDLQQYNDHFIGSIPEDENATAGRDSVGASSAAYPPYETNVVGTPYMFSVRIGQTIFDVEKIVGKDGFKRLIFMQKNYTQDLPLIGGVSAEVISGRLFDGKDALQDIRISRESPRGLMRPILELFFREFPEVRAVDSNVGNLPLLKVLYRDFGFRPAPGTKPNIYALGRKFYMSQQTFVLLEKFAKCRVYEYDIVITENLDSYQDAPNAIPIFLNRELYAPPTTSSDPEEINTYPKPPVLPAQNGSGPVCASPQNLPQKEPVTFSTTSAIIMSDKPNLGSSHGRDTADSPVFGKQEICLEEELYQRLRRGEMPRLKREIETLLSISPTQCAALLYHLAAIEVNYPTLATRAQQIFTEATVKEPIIEIARRGRDFARLLLREQSYNWDDIVSQEIAARLTIVEKFFVLREPLANPADLILYQMFFNPERSIGKFIFTKNIGGVDYQIMLYLPSSQEGIFLQDEVRIDNKHDFEFRDATRSPLFSNRILYRVFRKLMAQRELSDLFTAISDLANRRRQR
ncbi:MAG: GNAT family N-acetyltransferase [Candidatus Omnitrophica bacterium]|nr:GNAT family N-acetyltransferase [Candidatus Omnitrophota bacterium]